MEWVYSFNLVACTGQWMNERFISQQTTDYWPSLTEIHRTPCVHSVLKGLTWTVTKHQRQNTNILSDLKPPAFYKVCNDKQKDVVVIITLPCFLCICVWLVKILLYRVSLHLSLSFNGHFPGEPGLAGIYWSKGWWRLWWQLDYRSYTSWKAPAKSSPPRNQHPFFYRPGALPVAQPTVSKHCMNTSYHVKHMCYPSTDTDIQSKNAYNEHYKSQ